MLERKKEREREIESDRERDREERGETERLEDRRKRNGEEMEIMATVVRGSRNRAGGGPALTDYGLASRRQVVWWGDPRSSTSPLSLLSPSPPPPTVLVSSLVRSSLLVSLALARSLLPATLVLSLLRGRGSHPQRAARELRGCEAMRKWGREGKGSRSVPSE